MKKRKIVAVVMVVGTVLLTTFSFYGYQTLKSPNILVNGESKVLFVPNGADFSTVRDSLYEGKFLQDIVSFSFLAKLMDYDVAVKPGRYVLDPNMSNLEAIRLLRAGNQKPTTVTFNNVRLISDLAEKITANIEMTPDEFRSAFNRFIEKDDSYTESTGISIFIPNTYEVYWTISPDALIERMISEFDNFWNSERLEKANKLNLTPLEVSTLASIVQAETRHIQESPEIAGLYVNRLRQDMPLQADPTLVFATGDFTLKRVLNVHKEVESPYNTYKYKGLPPGPINLPEIWALDAVLNHNEHNYIYMCAREDFSGYHNFASDLSTHNLNAARYQRALTIEQMKARQAL